MKIFFLVFLATSWTQGKTLDVPENCWAEQKSPCLTKILDQEEKIKLNNNTFRLIQGTIIQWDSFGKELSAILLEGALQMDTVAESFKLNQVVISKNELLIERKDNILNILDLNTFLLSTYTLSSIQANSVLEKSVFLEKLELLEFVSHFFFSKNSFKSFMKSIESRWKIELKAQALTQTKVLKRSIANTEQNERHQKLTQAHKDQQFKKVREEFFYRTFYR